MKTPIVVPIFYGSNIQVADDGFKRTSLRVFTEQFPFCDCKILPFQTFFGTKGVVILHDKGKFYLFERALNYPLVISFLQEKKVLISGPLNYQLLPAIWAEHRSGLTKFAGKLYLKNKFAYMLFCLLLLAFFLVACFLLLTRFHSN